MGAHYMKTIKGHIDGIIFDMDGTIIDTEHVWESATEELLRHHNLHPETIPEDKLYVFEEMVGKGLYESVALLHEAFNMSHTTPQAMTEFVLENVKEKFQEEMAFIHGFEHFHKQILDAGIPISIATNCDPHSLEHIVDRMGFSKLFGENIYCVAHVENKAKPDPAMFLHAADRLGADPTKCLVFEDSYWGFQAAKAANMKCIAIKNKKNAHMFHEHTHGHIESYHDAEDVIKNVIKNHFTGNN